VDLHRYGTFTEADLRRQVWVWVCVCVCVCVRCFNAACLCVVRGSVFVPACSANAVGCKGCILCGCLALRQKRPWVLLWHVRRALAVGRARAAGKRKRKEEKRLRGQ